MVNALKEVNKPIKFDDFLNIICSKVGDVKSREGINRIFQIWDQNNNGFIYFKSFKRIAR
jgi:Ca2+-binding EF-hand superfamily protein